MPRSRGPRAENLGVATGRLSKPSEDGRHRAAGLRLCSLSGSSRFGAEKDRDRGTGHESALGGGPRVRPGYALLQKKSFSSDNSAANHPALIKTI